MLESSQVAGFLAAVMVLVVVPGPNTMVILTHSLSGGRAAGLATVAGVETGTVVHTLAAALGLSTLLAHSALAYGALQYAGAAYLVYIGLRALSQPPASLTSTVEHLRPTEAYRRAVLTNVLNPKVALFFLAFLPQFVRPEQGAVFPQILLLGAIVSLVGAGFGATLALAAGSFAHWLRGHHAFLRFQHRATGALLLALGVRLAIARR